MQRAVVLLGLAALLAACGPESPAPAPPPTATNPAPVAGRAADSCDLLLDPVTKNTDLVELFYQMSTYSRPAGVDRIVITLPVAHTYDARKAVALIPTDPLQGDSIFFDPAARGAVNALASYTLVTDPTLPANQPSYPAADAIGPPDRPRVSKGLRYGVALVDLDPYNGGHWASAKGGLAVPLAAARAQQGYGRLSVKVVADLAPPGILTGQEIHPATKTTGEWEVDLRYIAGRTVCAAIVTAVDGEMVKRLR